MAFDILLYFLVYIYIPIYIHGPSLNLNLALYFTRIGRHK